MPLSGLLYQLKHKTLTPQDIRGLLQLMKQTQSERIPLWRISSLVRLTTGTARIQAYLILYAGLLFVPPAVYEKYCEHPQKLTRLVIYTPIALAFLMAPLMLYRRTTKKMLQAIDYHLPTNTLELHTYKKQLLKVPISQLSIKFNPTKPKIVHQISVSKQSNAKVFKVEGFGEWQSLQILHYLNEKGSLSVDNLQQQ